MLTEIKNKIDKQDIILELKVIPNSSKCKIDGFLEINGKNILKVKVDKVTEKGKANKSVIETIAKNLNISESRIEIIKGFTNQFKTILIKKLE